MAAVHVCGVRVRARARVCDHLIRWCSRSPASTQGLALNTLRRVTHSPRQETSNTSSSAYGTDSRLIAHHSGMDQRFVLPPPTPQGCQHTAQSRDGLFIYFIFKEGHF